MYVLATISDVGHACTRRHLDIGHPGLDQRNLAYSSPSTTQTEQSHDRVSFRLGSVWRFNPCISRHE